VRLAALDLQTIPAGCYRVEQRARIVNVQIDRPAHGRWAGWVFVLELHYDGKQRLVGRCAPGQLYRGGYMMALRAIRLNPGYYRRKFISWRARRGVDGRLRVSTAARM
jgi:hypothetical protein